MDAVSSGIHTEDERLPQTERSPRGLPVPHCKGSSAIIQVQTEEGGYLIQNIFRRAGENTVHTPFESALKYHN